MTRVRAGSPFVAVQFNHPDPTFLLVPSNVQTAAEGGEGCGPLATKGFEARENKHSVSQRIESQASLIGAAKRVRLGSFEEDVRRLSRERATLVYSSRVTQHRATLDCSKPIFMRSLLSCCRARVLRRCCGRVAEREALNQGPACGGWHLTNEPATSSPAR